MKYKIIVLISILSLSSGICLSQQVNQPDSLKLYDQHRDSTEHIQSGVSHRGPLSRLGGDLFSQVTAIFHMSMENALWVGSGLLVTGALIASDQGTYNTIHRTRQNNHWMKSVSPYISELGSLYGISIVGLFTGYGLIFRDSKALETSYLAAESVLTSGIWTRTLKLMAGRERPSARNVHSHEAGGEWWGLLQEFRKNNDKRSASSYDAFPSGHTATAFSIATVIANQYSGSTFVPIISYTLASLVGIARIVEDTHWASDVFVGAVIGYLTSKQILNSNPSEVSREKERTEFTDKKKKFGDQFSWTIDPFDKTLFLAYHF